MTSCRSVLMVAHFLVVNQWDNHMIDVWGRVLAFTLFGIMVILLWQLNCCLLLMILEGFTNTANMNIGSFRPFSRNWCSEMVEILWVDVWCWKYLISLVLRLISGVCNLNHGNPKILHTSNYLGQHEPILTCKELWVILCSGRDVFCVQVRWEERRETQDRLIKTNNREYSRRRCILTNEIKSMYYKVGGGCFI